MKDKERQVPADRVEDLEVREDEAREIAGGKRKEIFRYGKSAKARAQALYPHKKES